MLTAGDVAGGTQLLRQQCPVAGRLAGQPLSAEDRLKVSWLRTGYSNRRSTNEQSQTSAAIDVAAGAQTA